jgi:NDP-sugar pyrophosphorylase family protein
MGRAKAAVPVDGEPLVRRVIAWLVSAGVPQIVLNLHHKPESITRVVGDGLDLGARVRYSWESDVLGSAGGPRHALPILEAGPGSTPDGSAPLLIVNGDTLTDVALDGLADSHRRTGALVTMALIPNTQPHKYGGVVLDDEGIVTGFTKRGSSVPSLHFIGVQAADRSVFADLPDGVVSESVLQIYPAMMRAQPGSVRGFVTEAAFHDVGTPSDLLAASLAFAAAGGRDGRPHWGSGTQVDPSARLVRSCLWDDVIVGADASLEECIVADGVRIEAGERFSRCAFVNDDRGDRIVHAIA